MLSFVLPAGYSQVRRQFIPFLQAWSITKDLWSIPIRSVIMWLSIYAPAGSKSNVTAVTPWQGLKGSRINHRYPIPRWVSAEVHTVPLRGILRIFLAYEAAASCGSTKHSSGDEVTWQPWVHIVFHYRNNCRSGEQIVFPSYYKYRQSPTLWKHVAMGTCSSILTP